ncbi:MAG TPA: aminotransferase class V-fold PLP-dependent enzyme [Gaiellaceae bacterium]|nr:aminotransferase class V-fold PLP-dependent enzyme [Gaiellaceae bacterium]
MTLDRRAFLVRSGLALAAAGLLEHESDEAAAAPQAAPLPWRAVRAQFRLTPVYVHLGGLLLASHPTPVRRAIETHRRALDRNPVHYLHERGPTLEARVLSSAGSYLGARPTDIALTDSTTMGLSLLYNGIDLRAGQEALTTEHDFFVTHEALRLKAERSGASVRRVRLYDRSENASTDAIVDALVRAVRPRTRVVAITWVHSSTGVKLPVRRIADRLASINANRDDRDRALLCVDGVHGLGVENVTMSGLGCDYFAAGCHKWLFGPRGTGIVWGHARAWPFAGATIPSFSGGGPGAYMTPGGFHSFEHRWALGEAFRFHQSLGKERVERRIHMLNRRLKAGLASMSHVTLKTPRSDALSAGLVCFDVRGLSPSAVVAALRRRRIIGTVTPYTPSYARLAAGLLNTPRDVDRALSAIRTLR